MYCGSRKTLCFLSRTLAGDLPIVEKLSRTFAANFPNYGKPYRTLAGSFPWLGKPVAHLQDTFPTPGKVAANKKSRFSLVYRHFHEQRLLKPLFLYHFTPNQIFFFLPFKYKYLHECRIQVQCSNSIFLSTRLSKHKIIIIIMLYFNKLPYYQRSKKLRPIVNGTVNE